MVSCFDTYFYFIQKTYLYIYLLDEKSLILKIIYFK
jgi:hypothetical protein